MYEKNQELEITIDNLTSEGLGVGKAEGFAFFVEGGLPEERLLIKIVKLKKTYGYGKIVKILESSPHRVTPPCPVYKRCGGCHLQHMDYDSQITYKAGKVKEVLKRIGGLDMEINPVLAMEGPPWRYRNKAQFPVREVNGKITAGFYAARSHELVPVEDCLLQREVNQRIVAIILDFMREKVISAYDEDTHRGLVRHIMTRIGFKTDEIMVCLIINGDDLPHSETLAARLAEIPGMASITLNINKSKTNVITGDRIKPLWGREFIYDYIGGVKFKISPLSFFQVNPVQTERLYAAALTFAEVGPEDDVMDLYCGIGSVGLCFAGKVKRVTGVEILSAAIEDAQANAEINGISNACFLTGDVEAAAPLLLRDNPASLLILDPPRKGCGSGLLYEILAAQPDKILYISCEPSTLARDLKILSEGYIVKKVGIVDMFSQTNHVETVVLLQRKDFL